MAGLHEVLGDRAARAEHRGTGRPAGVDRGHRPQPGVATAYGSAPPRLRELKRLWDPDYVFRHNHNIESGG